MDLIHNDRHNLTKHRTIQEQSKTSNQPEHRLAIEREYIQRNHLGSQWLHRQQTPTLNAEHVLVLVVHVFQL